MAGDGVSGFVDAIATDRNNNGTFEAGENGLHITDADNPSTSVPGYGMATQVLSRNTRVSFTVTLPAGCRFNTATGFPTAATAQVRAEFLRNSHGPQNHALEDGILGDDPTTFGAPQCVAGVISGISGDGRTATITATFVERRVYDVDPITSDDWATYKVNNVQVRIAAYCNL